MIKIEIEPEIKMMKTIVQGGIDKSMVYNVEPVENQLNDWDPERGFYEDYDLSLIHI